MHEIYALITFSRNPTILRKSIAFVQQFSSYVLRLINLLIGIFVVDKFSNFFLVKTLMAGKPVS